MNKYFVRTKWSDGPIAQLVHTVFAHGITVTDNNNLIFWDEKHNAVTIYRDETWAHVEKVV